MIKGMGEAFATDPRPQHWYHHLANAVLWLVCLVAFGFLMVVFGGSGLLVAWAIMAAIIRGIAGLF